MHTIYCFNNGGPYGFMEAIALGDDGHCVASHVCTSVRYMPGDLGVVGTHKHDLYDAHFGSGNWRLEWVDDADRDSHVGLQAALRLAMKLDEQTTAAEAAH